ncbi:MULTISPECIES: hypothetical protein [unclassified Streptomyces]|uniref:hypothetical protein n=1 Tax=unclassified Streptomyces TaxID=2593676 RepID=UPI00378DC6F3
MSTQILPVTETNGHVFVNDEAEVYWVDGCPPIAGPIDLGCRSCAKQPARRVVEGAVHVLDPCPYPDGIRTEITVSVPSGKLIVADDLRPAYDFDGAAVRYNTDLGKAHMVHGMASMGCAFGPARSGGLGLYRTDPDRYLIASPASADGNETAMPGAVLLAPIDTVVWSYAIADYEHWISRGGTPDGLDSYAVVDVPPGRYIFTHLSLTRSFDHEAAGDVIYARIQRAI